jgi:DNA-binding FrmR family transcriptional regulator
MLLEERSEIIRRLRVSEGHLHAIIGMVETNQPYDQIIHQLRAVRAALRASSGFLLTYQVEQSQAIILHGLRDEERIAEVEKLRSLFSIVTHSAEFQGDIPYE